jgi:hypothetical protein
MARVSGELAAVGTGSGIIGQLEEEQMHSTPIERIKLALRALPSHDTNARALTPSELERLKSWFEGDAMGMSAARIAQEVIQHEMQKQKNAHVRSASE